MTPIFRLFKKKNNKKKLYFSTENDYQTTTTTTKIKENKRVNKTDHSFDVGVYFFQTHTHKGKKIELHFNEFDYYKSNKSTTAKIARSCKSIILSKVNHTQIHTFMCWCISLFFVLTFIPIILCNIKVKKI